LPGNSCTARLLAVRGRATLFVDSSAMEKEDKARIGMNTPATEDDCHAGRAVFFIPDNRSTVYDLGAPLPLIARLKQDTETSSAEQQEVIPAGTQIEIIQCEIGDNGEILVGYRYDGGEGLCMLSEIEMMEP
jgi:hypothetical protein